MGTIPRFSRPGQFDRYCKLVLEHEAIDYLRKMDSLRVRHISLGILPQKEMDKLSTVDSYPSDSHVFTSHGCDLHINNELVADAFASLSAQTQSILILRFVLDLGDAEIGSLVGMSRSAVQRRRKKTLDELRNKLTALMPKGG
ncbi:MAG: sigma-70 family RNA polymerase sigma factor [Oscillibacter sp.]|uniref:sigma-70 family RNA polymerase sigma factor n=1 Tax=Oscillibacter sp. TaxID=1945593 RepID=UPI00216BA7AD|nr:sigma-70 family RNA polymerase sigma factor [Oscillibacter sp.]MCI9114076.1 sigma-70 family RNA polymerase sigma factor [Oscillibacter sp.]